MDNPTDAWRRWFGLLFLVLAGGMLIWGLTVLDGRLKGWGFVVYWFACLGFTVAAWILGWLDWHAVRRRTRRTPHRPPQPPPASDGNLL